MTSTGAPARVLAGVVQQVPEDPLEPTRVRFDDQRRGRELERRLRQAGRGDGPHQAREIDRLERDLLGARIEARHLHQVVHQRAQPADVGDEQLAGAPALGRQRVEVLAQDRRLGDERGQRRSQFVATSATKRRFCASAASSRPIVSARASAIRLKRSAHVPNSSSEVTGTRADRSPCSSRSAARLAASTGASTPRAMTRATSSARRMRAIVPTVSASRSWASASSMRGHVVDEVEGRPAPPGRPPTTRLGLPPTVVQA